MPNRLFTADEATVQTVARECFLAAGGTLDEWHGSEGTPGTYGTRRPRSATEVQAQQDRWERVARAAIDAIERELASVVAEAFRRDAEAALRSSLGLPVERQFR